MALAAEGADIVVNDRARQEETQAVVEAIVKMGAQAMDYHADVSERSEVQSMVEAVVKRFGRLDIAVANAAYSVRQAIADLKWEDVQQVTAVTQFGVFSHMPACRQTDD